MLVDDDGSLAPFRMFTGHLICAGAHLYLHSGSSYTDSAICFPGYIEPPICGLTHSKNEML